MLRLAVLVESRVIPAWQRRVIQEAVRLGQVEVGVTPPDRGSRAHPFGGLLWRLFLALDRRWHPAEPDALRPVPLGMADGIARPGPEDAPFDVVLDLRAGGREAAPSAPRHGVWRVLVNGGPHTGTAAFGVLDRAAGVVTTALEITAQRGTDEARVVTWSTSVEVDSAYRTLSRSSWNAYHLIVRQLRLMPTVGTDRGSSGERVPRRSAPSAPPGGLAVLGFAVRVAIRAVLRRIRRRRYREEWYVAVRPKRWRTLAERDGRGFIPLSLPSGHFHADPFLIERGGTTYLFFEDYSYRERKGVIGCRSLAKDGAAGAPETVLERPYHLSYPFVFEQGGAVYLMPESVGNGTVELYRAVDFPRGWRLERLLMRDVRAADATLFAHEGTLWLFANVAEPGTSDWDALHVFYSDSLAGDWRAHPLNPVVRDVRSARPAGRLFWDGDRLIRPAQDCSVRYGSAITLNRVDVLTKSDYAETPIQRIAPDGRRGDIGTHTIDHTDGMEAVDARRVVASRGGAGTRVPPARP